jgi:PilZ domain
LLRKGALDTPDDKGLPKVPLPLIFTEDRQTKSNWHMLQMWYPSASDLGGVTPNHRRRSQPGRAPPSLGLRFEAAAMPPDKRRSPRKKINTVGFLYTTAGWPLGECQMKDISAGGARLVHSLADALPTEFLLSLSRDGRVRRRCEIRWREENQVGVRFV